MFSNTLAISLWERLDEWDKALFIKLNSHYTNPVFDAVFPFLRNSVTWAPLYIFVLVFMASNFGKKGIWWSVFFLCTVALTDVIGFQVLKESVKRIRPCENPELSYDLRLLLKKCSTSYSFVSNHAANHFAIATFAVLTFRGFFKKWIYIAYLWAFIIAYAQVYVGVHYPLDVVGGALLGILVGSFTAFIFNQKWGSITRIEGHYTN